MRPSPGNKERLTKTRSTFWAHRKADLALSRDTTPLWVPVPLLIPHSGHHFERAVNWSEKKHKLQSIHKPETCTEGKCNPVYQLALWCCWQPVCSDRRTATTVGKNMELGCLYKALLMPLESISCPAFLLHTQVPGTQPGSPGFCLQLSFRPPSKFLFYTALPGTPTVPKLSPHYRTAYKRDLIFMPEHQLLGALPLHEACAGAGSHAAAAGNLADWHGMEAAQTNMAVNWPACWMQVHASTKLGSFLSH